MQKGGTMEKSSQLTTGQRIHMLRKRKGYKQKELAEILGKSLRTVQKYESGDIDISIAVINQLADVLDSTPTFILGYDDKPKSFTCLADVFASLFNIEAVKGIDFSIEVDRPPRYRGWKCSLSFNGRSLDSDYNADMCLFLEDWEDARESLRSLETSRKDYETWKEKTLAYYAGTPVESDVPEPVSREDQVAGRATYLEDKNQEI
jgi:transcriptional regulator with XRE-family HTH domain